MRESHTFMDDMMKLSGNILGNLLGARHEMRAQAKQRLDSLARQLNLVSREEFDAAFSMLQKARVMQDELSERLDSIESRLGMSSTTAGAKKTKRRLPSLTKSNTRKKRS
ncbi:MAG: accessory factor UbiK family protein [Bdellovibrionales bacterium]